MAKPLISVIVPIYNEAKNIRQTLTPLQAWRGKEIEVIVVDGGSSDESVALTEACADQVLTARQGRARQMNAGAKLACGDYLLFLHADTRISAAALDEVLLLCRKKTSHWGFFSVRLGSPRLIYRVIENFMNWRARLTHIATGDQSLFISATVFKELGGYDDIPLMEDIAMSKRLRRICAPEIIRRAVKTSARRWEINGVLATILLMWRLRLAYFFGVSPTTLHRQYYKSSDSGGD